MSPVDHVMTALQLDKVFEAGGVTIEDLRQENASKVRVHDMFSRILNFLFVCNCFFLRKNNSYIGIS